MQARAARETARRRPASTATDAGSSSSLADSLAALILASPGGEAVARLIELRIRDATGGIERERLVLDAMLPPAAVLSDAATTQLRWNAEALTAAVREFGALTAAELSEIRGVATTNPHTTVSRWAKDRRVFAIESPQGRLFPAFQFTDGEPRPVIGQVLGALDGQLTGRETLLWFTGSSGFLDGARPVDRLADEPERVIAAAAHQASLSQD